METLRGEKVLVAGGAGFVGSQLVLELLDLGADVVVYDNLLHGSRENLEDVADRITLVLGDVLDEWKLTEAFRAHRPSYVFNLVGDTYVPTAYDVPKRFFRINIEGNLNVLMACKVFGVKRVLYVSSTEVYGEARSTPMDETHAYDPLNTYAVSKLAADRLCFTFFHEHQIPVIIARIYNAYGPRETEPYVIPEIIAQLHKSNVVHLGNIEARRDFTYVADTARGLIAALGSTIPNGEAVNVGSNVAYSVRELAEALGHIMGHDSIDIQIDPRRLRHFDIGLFQCDPSRLHGATGWKPQVGLEQGLQMTVDWFRTHGCRWVWESRLEGAIIRD
jgi:nucleoside-diphosphate-sugar epimerase